MIKGCFLVVVFFVILTGVLYYIYEKHGEEIDEFAKERYESFYEKNVRPFFGKFTDDYADSVKEFLEEKFEALEKEDLKISEGKFDELKKMLSEYSKRKIIDSVDFHRLKKLFGN
jgi:cbb3-type cytochrome oxidase subunit 3